MTKPPCLCGCGQPSIAKGLARRCYNRRYYLARNAYRAPTYQGLVKAKGWGARA